MMSSDVIFGADQFACDDGFVFAHVINTDTSEYIGQHKIFVSRGTSLPIGAFLDSPPPSKSGFAIVRCNDSWEYVPDFRGEKSYNKADRQLVVISELGPVPPNLTLKPPKSSFDVWKEELDDWIKDVDAELAALTYHAKTTRFALMSEASQEISTLVDALDPSIGGAPDESDQVRLNLWRCYRIELSKVDLQSTYPYQINWPSKPF